MESCLAAILKMAENTKWLVLLWLCLLSDKKIKGEIRVLHNPSIYCQEVHSSSLGIDLPVNQTC